MILKKCPNCQKDIPGLITVCPYCNRDKEGRQTGGSAKPPEIIDSQLQADLRGLTNDDPLTRASAADRMLQKGSAVVPALVAFLNDSAFKGVGDVIQVLGRLKDRRSVGALIQAMKTG